MLEACRRGERTVDSVIATLEESGLRGLGGAGFPVGRKWRVVRGEPAPRLMAINIDEGEPGTFKDRVFLETDPPNVEVQLDVSNAPVVDAIHEVTVTVTVPGYDQATPAGVAWIARAGSRGLWYVAVRVGDALATSVTDRRPGVRVRAVFLRAHDRSRRI